MRITKAKERTKSCDFCAYQEGRHYCLFHSKSLKNMDTIRCSDWSQMIDGKQMFSANSLLARIESYLGNGGLFNPEMMEQDKVRDLIVDCREYIEQTLLADSASDTEQLDGAGRDARSGEGTPRIPK